MALESKDAVPFDTSLSYSIHWKGTYVQSDSCTY